MAYYTKIMDIKESIEKNLDEYCYFYWRDKNMFQEFGAFIIGSPKFFNGPSFKNEYSKAMFSSEPELVGVSFETQVINFTVAVVGITEEKYRKLIYWLDPYVVDNLSFGFEPNYRYIVKLMDRTEAKRDIIGVDNFNKDLYYTELRLKFEVQGAQCAIGKYSYISNFIKNTDSTFKGTITNMIEDKRTKEKKLIQELPDSDLAYPILSFFNIPLQAKNTANFTGEIILDVKANYTDQVTLQTEFVNLFNVKFKNLTIAPPSADIPLILSIKYDSQKGLLFLTYGNGFGKERILNLLTTSDSGQHIVDSFTCNKFFLPGKFDFPDFSLENFKIEITIDAITYQGDGSKRAIHVDWLNIGTSNIIAYPRTNVI